MAISNHERVGKALELLKNGLQPFVERELKEQHKQLWFEEFKASLTSRQLSFAGTEDQPRWDVATVLKVMWDQWHKVFRKVLGQSDRSLVSELRDVRNRWAHQNPFSSDDAYRALDSVSRLLATVSAPQAGDVKKRRCCTARSKSLTSLCRLQSHPAQYVSGIPSAAILLSISHPIRCSTRCLANVRARISGPMIAL